MFSFDLKLFEALRSLGIDFSASFSELEPVQFTDMEESLGSYPAFRDGVLFCNGRDNSKGDVLHRFLREVAWRPECVVFVDDALHNLTSVEAAMERLGIPCLCFHYRGVEELYSEEIPLEEFLSRWRRYVEAVQVANFGSPLAAYRFAFFSFGGRAAA